MYLTKEEFIVLKGIKEGLVSHQIKEKYGISVGTIDPKMEALYAKYGANDKQDLVKKADLDKVEICEKENIPYFEYDNDEGG